MNALVREALSLLKDFGIDAEEEETAEACRRGILSFAVRKLIDEGYPPSELLFLSEEKLMGFAEKTRWGLTDRELFVGCLLEAVAHTCIGTNRKKLLKEAGKLLARYYAKRAEA